MPRNYDWNRHRQVREQDYKNADENTSEREMNYLRKFASDSDIKRKETKVWTPKGYKYIIKGT